MSLRFQVDNDLRFGIVKAIRLREPAIDFASDQEAGLESSATPEVLGHAAREYRILVSHDRRTMPEHSRASGSQEGESRPYDRFTRRDDVPRPLDAIGFLMPKPERRAIMACTWLGTKWLGRVPDDKAVFRCFSTDPDVSREAALADLNHLMGITAEPIFALNHRWPNSMPQYSVGHSARVAEIDARTAAIPGLSLIGNALYGIGIPDCVRSAQKAAEKIGKATAA